MRYSFKNISEFNKQFGLPEPENSLFSFSHSKPKETKVKPNEQRLDNTMEITCEFYSIGFKKIVSGEIVYGRTKYDFSKGLLLFTAPNQTLSFKEVVVSSDSYHIAFHKDYLIGNQLFQEIKKYNFFDYHVNEALHLSSKEEKLIRAIFKNIEAEQRTNRDEFSKKIVLSHLDTLMQYTDRFYKRQFLNRKEINKALFTHFKRILDSYYEEGKLMKLGIPSVEWISGQLGVSYRYMGDTIKAETGKTAIEQINLYLIEQAKYLLLTPNVSISETAYNLGFKYPQYFSRLFKQKVGMSPKQFIEQAQMS